MKDQRIFSTRYQHDSSEIEDALTLMEALKLAAVRARAAKEGSNASVQDIYQGDEYYLTVNTKGE